MCQWKGRHLWEPRTSSETLNWAFLRSGRDRENGLWPSHSSISPSSGPSRSSGSNGPTNLIWPKSSYSCTRWGSPVASWTVRFCGRGTERSLPALVGCSPRRSSIGSLCSPTPCSVGIASWLVRRKWTYPKPRARRSFGCRKCHPRASRCQFVFVDGTTERVDVDGAELKQPTFDESIRRDERIPWITALRSCAMVRPCGRRSRFPSNVPQS